MHQSTRVSERVRSCSGTQQNYLVSLRALRTLHHVELDRIAFFEALVSIKLYGAVVHKDVG